MTGSGGHVLWRSHVLWSNVVVTFCIGGYGQWRVCGTLFCPSRLKRCGKGSWGTTEVASNQVEPIHRAKSTELYQESCNHIEGWEGVVTLLLRGKHHTSQFCTLQITASRRTSQKMLSRLASADRITSPNSSPLTPSSARARSHTDILQNGSSYDLELMMANRPFLLSHL